MPKIAAADTAVRELELHPDDAHLRAAHDAIKAIRDLLLPHLDIEDRELLPAAHAKVPADEWERLGDEAMRAIPKRDLPIAVAAMDEVQQGLPESSQPPPPPLPIRLLLPFARRRFKKFVAPLDA